jgi:hypothetical protein
VSRFKGQTAAMPDTDAQKQLTKKEEKTPYHTGN